ncbi:MAG TPA: transcription termination factor NusA [Actinomycetota bacterium]
MDLQEMLDAMRTLGREKSIAFEALLAGLEQALAAAYKRSLPEDIGVRVEVDPHTGEIHVFEHDLDEEGEPILDDLGNFLDERPMGPRPFGRIEAQTAKQVILQKIREAEREQTFTEYTEREGDIVTGIVQQSDTRYTLLDLGKVEALMPHAEQVPSERYEHNARLKAYVVEVRRNPRGPSIIVSRTHPGLVRRLFELEVPEIAEGLVSVDAIAREPGYRTKVAVSSREPGVDAVGACIGAKGSRVRMVMQELRGEKIDIVDYAEDPATFVANALSPANVSDVRISERDKHAVVVVPDYQLSLAIGKEGQNARLAARLTGWKVDIKSESQIAEEARGPEPPAEPGPAADAPAPESAAPDVSVSLDESREQEQQQ